MKVCTDASLFGAVIAGSVQSAGVNAILDIGCGTGLLSLMLAQKTNAAIDAVEMDAQASLQARENIRLSAWKDRINIIHADARIFEFKKKYDLIISNPPFYKDHLRSLKESINVARHNESMSFENLVDIAGRHLSPSGCFAVLVPYQSYENFVSIAAASGMHLTNHLLVQQTPGHDFFRSILQFTLQPSPGVKKERMAIKNSSDYSTAFVQLLKDYYLNL